MPTLYIVPTPIGNLEDITLRALRILREAALIAAEDTRTTRILLQHYAITTPLTAYHAHNEYGKTGAILQALTRGDVALVSDAGTPGISDPGAGLIREAIAQGVRVEALPGANAAITALVASGLPTDEFIFAGFAPKKDKARREWLMRFQTDMRTLILYESPNRLTDMLDAIIETLGDRAVCVGREITKKFEEYQRGTASAVRAYYTANPPRGEIVLIVGGAAPIPPTLWDEGQLLEAIRARLELGERARAIADALAPISGWDRKRVYEWVNGVKKAMSDD